MSIKDLIEVKNSIHGDKFDSKWFQELLSLKCLRAKDGKTVIISVCHDEAGKLVANRVQDVILKEQYPEHDRLVNTLLLFASFDEPYGVRLKISKAVCSSIGGFVHSFSVAQHRNWPTFAQELCLALVIV